MNKQRLQQSQQLKLSPKQIQFLGLLQTPLTSLESKIEEELEKNPDAMKTLNVIRRESKTEHVTLLCFEPDGTPCHRHVLREILKKQKLLKESFIPKFVDN